MSAPNPSADTDTAATDRRVLHCYEMRLCPDGRLVTVGEPALCGASNPVKSGDEVPEHFRRGERCVICEALHNNRPLWG